MEINLLRSKTVIGAVMLALGHLLASGHFTDYESEFNIIGVVLEGLGVILGGIGVRTSIAKAAKGVAQLHPVMMAFAVAASVWAMPVAMLSLQGPNAPPTNPRHFADLGVDEWYPGWAGDSLKYVILWKQAADSVARGKIDSTVYSLKSSKAAVWFTGNAIAANTNVRRVKGPTVFADSFKLVKPALGDSAVFQIVGFIQCRKGDCSVPGSAGWKYRETFAPPPAAPTIRIETF